MLNSVVYWDIHAARLIIISSILASGAPQPERKTPIQKTCPYNQSWSPGLQCCAHNSSDGSNALCIVLCIL